MWNLHDWLWRWCSLLESRRVWLRALRNNRRRCLAKLLTERSREMLRVVAR